MKGPLDRTKVVLRHLPPTISQSNLVEHIDSHFCGRYRWLAFRPGKSSPKHLTYSRAYIDFNKPGDVIEFAEFFGGHVFVNEKGTQFKTTVEYAPSQRVPKQWSKKDGREGTILKDPEYLEFLELLARPVENLPSAEIQLERKEAERAGAPKDPVVTPLMDYVRQKRASKGGARRTILNGKSTRRASGISSRMQASSSSKRGAGKRTPTTMYVLRENAKGDSGKDKSTNFMVRKQDEQQLKDNLVVVSTVSRSDAVEGESGGSGTTESRKKKILLVKGKGKELSNNQRREGSGRIIKTILLNRDSRLNQQPSSVSQSERQINPLNQEKDKKKPRPPSSQSFQKDVNGFLEDYRVENNEKRTRNKDRPDRGVWTPFRRSDGQYASDESLSSSASQTSDSVEGTRLDMKRDGGEYRPRGSNYSENGSYRHGGRRGSNFTVKDASDASTSFVEGKPSKRGSGFSGYGTHEKHVWVQKSSPGS